MSKYLVLRAARTSCCLLVMAAVPGAAVHARSIQPPDAETVVDAFHAALARGDAAAAASLLADDAVVYEQGRAERSKAEYVDHHLPGDAEFAPNVRRDVVTRTPMRGQNFNIIASEVRATGTYKGKAVNQLGTETMVLKLTPAGWRIVHVHWSSRAVAK